jgi:hypothetical protein
MVSYNSQITMIISLKSFNRLHFVIEMQSVKNYFLIQFKLSLGFKGWEL